MLSIVGLIKLSIGCALPLSNFCSLCGRLQATSKRRSGAARGVAAAQGHAVVAVAVLVPVRAKQEDGAGLAVRVEGERQRRHCARERLRPV